MPWHVETLILDRVFDVQRETGPEGNEPCTAFSFEAGGQRHFAICVPGHPALEAGHCLSFVLEKPGNWQTVQGWRNHSTGERVLPRAGLACFGLLVGLLMSALALFALWSSAHTRSASWGTGLGLVVGLCVSAGLGRQWQRQRQVIELIEALPSPTEALPGTGAPKPSA
ncbi:hypothetical protein QRD43_00865 [Pelomonas sp. APW6]|uniref:Uncharacterized protein n=1 Tax=Roseateles subflavus TaxID=3053353 RepID=A0ABT7LC53_9BURK|nr:hypothetical protein [Pelomonas sp. APW6]MDL5030440.1 hypothetical protein [Pelomonas sp. APW6]